MKKIIKRIITVFFLSVAVWCLYLCFKVDTYKNGVPKYFLEPDGYVIAKIQSEDDLGIIIDTFSYGYIKEEDYEDYINGTLTGNLVIKNPYEEGKQVVKSTDKIISIEVGIYEDYRGQD